MDKKIKNKLFLHISLFLFCLLMASCKKTSTEYVYTGGTEGLEISFVENEPPDSVLDNSQEEFYISLLLKNKGSYSIPSKSIMSAISGSSLSKYSIDFISNKYNNKLQSQTQGKWELCKAKYKSNEVTDFDNTINVNICYPYQTKAIANICLKKNLANINLNEVCHTNFDNIKTDNSGAPVQIKNLKELPVGNNEIVLSFDVVNKGSGIPYPKGTFYLDCAADKDKENKLDVAIETLSKNIPIQCIIFGHKNKGTVTLTNNTQRIVCRIFTSNIKDEAFKEPINILLDYYYLESISKSIRILDGIKR